MGLTDPEARAAAFHEAEKLAHEADKLAGEAAAEKLIQAADVLRHQLEDLVHAAAMLRRAIQADPRSIAALSRLREVSEARADWLELSDVLELLQRRAIDEEERADLLAKRGDVLGRKLGRIAEARSVYREVARVTRDEGLKRASTEASAKIDQILSERRSASTFAGAPWPPVAEARNTERDAESSTANLFKRAAVLLERGDRVEARALVDAGLAVDPDSEEGRQLLRKILRPQNRHGELMEALVRLADRSRRPESAKSALREAAQIASSALQHLERAIALWARVLESEPIDEAVLGEAVLRGVGQGRFDLAARVLPRWDALRRAELIERLAGNALLRGDDQAALELRAAAFFDDPREVRSFQAAVEILRAKKDETNLARALELRSKACEDPTERRAVLFELASLREILGQPMEAAEALLESIRISSAEDDVNDALSSIDRLSTTARERTLLTRAHGAAAAREGLENAERARHLLELAVILEELGDADSARAARSEAEAARGMGERPPIQIVDPFTSFEADPSIRAMQNATDSDWSKAVELTSMDTLIDRSLSAQERERLHRATLEAARRSGSPVDEQIGWHISEAARDTLDSVRVLPSLLPADEDAAVTPAALPAALSDMPAPAADPIEEIRVAVRRGQLEAALAKLASTMVDGEHPPADARLWLDAGNLARSFGRHEDAERCLSRAIDLADSDVLARTARRSLAEAFIAAGAYRDAALALIPTVEADRTQGRERALELSRIGELFFRDGDLFMAAGWLDDALNEDPACASAAIALVSIFAAKEDRAGVAELSAKVERASLAMAQRARWLTALGEAKRALGDRSGAQDAFALALVSDPLLIEPAESLIELGREASRADWIDDGLRELRARALARGSRSRGFLASALLVARGSAHEDDRATYESLRVALPSKPRAPIDARALLASLSGADRATAPLSEPAPIARDVRFESPVMREVIDALEASLTGAPVAVSALGLGEDLAKKDLKKAIFFDVARRYLATQSPDALAVEPVLDRAALVILQDPLIALETVGLGSSRGDELIAFAASGALPELWSLHGLGLDGRAGRTSAVAKGESGV